MSASYQPRRAATARAGLACVLDIGGGVDRLDAWTGAVLVMGLGSALVALIQWRAWRRHGFAV